MHAPSYFARVRAGAEKRWEQLDADPELAAPWRQLFLQVQSPRHVVSELLQNADDAGATKAEIRISDRTFIFEHNGRDFEEEEFLSLCRFGYSNKRSLHTIGHRGIGFKSTFSIGGTVELLTPTLSVAFHRERFTLPIWIDRKNASQHTRIRVEFADVRRQRELEANIEDWANNVESLLFFRNIRELVINNKTIRWEALGAGAPDMSEWFRRSDEPESHVLLVRDEEEAFPADALAEIRKERMLTDKESLEYPPCSVEIVLGAKGELFVVLPTRVSTLCPFASNAPFIQDPAREGIKDPNISPTNRWLLERIGRLAAASMLQWIEDSKLPGEERAAAYDILPPEVDSDLRPLDQSVAETIRASFSEMVNEKPYLLGFGQELYESGVVTLLPEEVRDTWPDRDMAPLLDAPGRVSLASCVAAENAEKLVKRDAVKELERSQVLEKLRAQGVPKPRSWLELLRLWSYVTRGGVRSWYVVPPYGDLHIIPVQGEEVLYQAQSVVRLSETKLLRSDDDWKFLSPYLRCMDRGWTRYLGAKRRSADDGPDPDSEDAIAKAHDLLRAVNLGEGADATRLIEQVCISMFEAASVRVDDAVRLAWIAAELNANVGKAMQYFTLGGSLEETNKGLVFDRNGTIPGLLPASWCDDHVVSKEYLEPQATRSLQTFSEWAGGNRSGLETFAIPQNVQKGVSGRNGVTTAMRRRGADAPLDFPYRSTWFTLKDNDFSDEFWEYWASAYTDDPEIYANVVERLMDTDRKELESRSQSWIWQNSSGGTYQKRIHDSPMAASWVLKMREFPCLRDTNGMPRKPSELMRRTATTEAFLGIEPFVHKSLDVEASAPLLDMLGVQTHPQNPDKVLERIEALSFSPVPPLAELENLYRRLDLICAASTTDDLARIRGRFESENLVFTESGEWKASTDVFIHADEEDVPGAAVIRSSVRDLSMWSRIGVAQRPTLGRAIEWLNRLPHDVALDAPQRKRVRALLGRYPNEIWTACGRWLTLNEQWTLITELRWHMSMQSLVPQAHLFEFIRGGVADFRMLAAEEVASAPFCAFPTLASCIREEIGHQSNVLREVEEARWLTEVGNLLAYARFDDPAVTERVSALALNLAETTLITVEGLEALPFIDGVPAGAKRRVNALWSGRNLFVSARSPARLAEDTVGEIERFFDRPDVTDALRMCFDRSADFIEEYIEENFVLGDDLPTSGPASGEEDSSKAVSDAAGNGKITTTPAAVSEPTESDRAQGLAVAMAEPRRRPRRKATLFERFATSQGFEKKSAHRYDATDGKWIERVPDSVLPWKLHTTDGKIVLGYWVVNQSLDSGAIEIPSEVWELTQRQPDGVVFVLADHTGAPALLDGPTLVRMHQAGKLTLHPASYRLQKKSS